MSAGQIAYLALISGACVALIATLAWIDWTSGKERRAKRLRDSGLA